MNGDSAVGKTSLILRYVMDTFSDEPVVTMQEEYKDKVIEVDGLKVKLQSKRLLFRRRRAASCHLFFAVWDTAGQERYRIITSSFYHNAQGSLIVYDVTNKESLDNVSRWSQEVDRYIDNSVKAVIGNKSDLNAVVMDGEAEEICDNVGALHFKTSAKSGEGIEAAFLKLTREMIAQKKDLAPLQQEQVQDLAEGSDTKCQCCVLF